MPALIWLAILAALLTVFSGCGSAPKQFYQKDGPPHPSEVPERIAHTPDAQPRVEPFHRYANRPYRALGRTYTPMTTDAPYRKKGMASWYGKQFHGNPTASGEPYDMFAMTAAHPTLPLPSYARVTNLTTGKQIVVRVNDRGPFLHGRIIDLSYAAAVKLGVANAIAKVEVERITHEDIRTGTFDPTPPPKPDHSPQNSAWSVQFGAFAVLTHAHALRDQIAQELSQANLSALPDDTRTPRVERTDNLYRVLVGATPTRRIAQQWAFELERVLRRSNVLHLSPQ